jgi:hypothetical protein
LKSRSVHWCNDPPKSQTASVLVHATGWP